MAIGPRTRGTEIDFESESTIVMETALGPLGPSAVPPQVIAVQPEKKSDT